MAGEPGQPRPLVHILNHYAELLCWPSVDTTPSCDPLCALSVKHWVFSVAWFLCDYSSYRQVSAELLETAYFDLKIPTVVTSI